MQVSIALTAINFDLDQECLSVCLSLFKFYLPLYTGGRGHNNLQGDEGGCAEQIPVHVVYSSHPAVQHGARHNPALYVHQ